MSSRQLRLTANPRSDDIFDIAGGYSLMAESRAKLDDRNINPPDVTLRPLAQHVVESDDRQVIFQVTYICRYP